MMPHEIAIEAEKWRMEAERLKCELLHRDITILPEKDAEYERLKQSMLLDIKVRESRIDEQNITIQKQFNIIRDLYKSSKRYEDEHQGLYEWELPSLHEAMKILEDAK